MADLNIDADLARRFPASGRYLVAVSGGRDSVVLLHSLVTNGYRKLIVCHLNHQLRGQSSRADARFVETLAGDYGLEIDSASVDLPAFARSRKMSIETAGREARYAFFARVAKRRRVRVIFIAHQADDLVETFLLNLFRGSGSAGLGAMPDVSEMRREKFDLTIVRPFLGIWRKDIDRYVRTHGLKFREDGSNREEVALRNRIRRRVIPYLEKTMDRAVRQTIWRTATIVADEEKLITAAIPSNSADHRSLDAKALLKLPVAVQRRMVHSWLRSEHVPNIGFELVERVRGLLDAESGVAKTNLPRDRHVRRRSGRLFIE